MSGCLSLTGTGDGIGLVGLLSGFTDKIRMGTIEELLFLLAHNIAHFAKQIVDRDKLFVRAVIIVLSGKGMLCIHIMPEETMIQQFGTVCRQL